MRREMLLVSLAAEVGSPRRPRSAQHSTGAGQRPAQAQLRGEERGAGSNWCCNGSVKTFCLFNCFGVVSVV